MLVCKFLIIPMFRNVTLKCLSEIAGLQLANYDHIFVALFKQTMEQFDSMIPATTNMNQVCLEVKNPSRRFNN